MFIEIIYNKKITFKKSCYSEYFFKIFKKNQLKSEKITIKFHSNFIRVSEVESGGNLMY